MNQKIIFENHFSARVIEIIFPDGFLLQTKDHLQDLKKQWQNNLKSWHTPYTCILDLRKFDIDPNLIADFMKLIQFFQKFHMRKIIGFKNSKSVMPDEFNFTIYDSYEQACENTGLSRGAGLSRNIENLRERIVIDNDFHAHVMEISFLSPTTLTSKEDIAILKRKITNILRQWHTPYSILFNCVNLQFEEEAKEEFYKLEKFLKGFFCKELLGYAPLKEKVHYPFETFRSRHIAAGRLESIGAHAGNAASCAPKVR